jgi:hypothetical protein
MRSAPFVDDINSYIGKLNDQMLSGVPAYSHKHSETLLTLFLPVLPTLLRNYPTGQAERKAARKMLPNLSQLNVSKYKSGKVKWRS